MYFILTQYISIWTNHISSAQPQVASGYHIDSAAVAFMVREHITKHYHKRELSSKSLVLLFKNLTCIF